MPEDLCLRKYGEAFDFYAQGGSCLPKTYTVIDCETTGFSPAYDVLLQMSHVDVVEGKTVRRGTYVLNWFGCNYLRHSYVTGRLIKAKQQYDKIGKPFRFSVERLTQEGKSPKKVMELYAGKFQGMLTSGVPLVGHNVKFDLSMLAATAELFAGMELPVDELKVVDTGALVKLHQAGWSPEPGEKLNDFTRRVISRTAAGLKWSLADFSIPHYLPAVVVDQDKSHEADYDVGLTAQLLERLRMLGDSCQVVAASNRKAEEDTAAAATNTGEALPERVSIDGQSKRHGVLPRKRSRRAS